MGPGAHTLRSRPRLPARSNHRRRGGHAGCDVHEGVGVDADGTRASALRGHQGQNKISEGLGPWGPPQRCPAPRAKGPPWGYQDSPESSLPCNARDTVKVHWTPVAGPPRGTACECGTACKELDTLERGLLVVPEHCQGTAPGEAKRPEDQETHPLCRCERILSRTERCCRRGRQRPHRATLEHHGGHPGRHHWLSCACRIAA